jgi:hypothetical protein
MSDQNQENVVQDNTTHSEVVQQSNKRAAELPESDSEGSTTTKKHKKSKKDRSLSQEDIQKIAATVAQLFNIQSAPGPSNASHSLGGSFPHGGTSSSAPGEHHGSGQVSSPGEGYPDDDDGDRISLHPKESEVGSVSEASSRARLREVDTEEPEDSRPEEKSLKKVLKVLQEVLADEMPARHSEDYGIKSLSSGGDIFQRKEVNTFPHSQLISSSFLHIQKRMTGEFNPDMSDPIKLPKSLDAAGWIQASINVPGYRDKFYGSKEDQFALAPPTIDPNLKSLIDKETAWEKREFLSAKDLAPIEKSLRRNLAVVSSMDLLIHGIRKVTDSLGHETNPYLNQLFESLSMSLGHAAAHSAQGVAASVIKRRDCFLRGAGSRIPSSIHEWMKCQPILSSAESSLFGNIAGEVRAFKQKEDANKANVSLSKLSSSQSKSSLRPTSTQGSQSKFKTPAPRVTSTPRSRPPQQSFNRGGSAGFKPLGPHNKRR